VLFDGALGVHILARHVWAMIYHTAQMSKIIKEGNHEASPTKREFQQKKKEKRAYAGRSEGSSFKNAIKLYAVLGRNPPYSTYLLEH